MDIRVIPAAPAPTSPRPPSTGAIALAAPAAAPAPATLLATPLTASRAKPPGRRTGERRVTIIGK